MTDLNVMMREQARGALQTALDAAVTNGDTAAATKIADDIAKLAVANAPKAPPYGDVEIRAALEKLDWFGIDPKKSAKAMEFGKMLDPKRFGTAELFAAAIVKAVDEEFKVAPAAGAEDPGEDENPGEGEDDKSKEAKPRRTDGPGESDTGNRSGTTRQKSGPWTKLADAPPKVQADIKRAVDKFAGSATKEQRESFTAKALESHYAEFQRNKGKK